jgi:HAE1 family hydrophobic/amphiphilic exporter-1/multidrug efflux pump
MSRFFIDRPIFAWVIAIIIMLAGILAIRTLPIAQFPAIAPPAVSITATYPGADAKTLENTTTQIIEQQLKGIDHLLYFSSSSSSAGTVTITLTFEQGTNPDIAQVQVQNKLQAATPLLPQEVQQQGLQVAKATKNFLMVIGLYSEDGAQRHRPCRLCRVEAAGPAVARERRRRYPDLRLAVRDAHLARSGQAQQICADHG